MLKKLTIPKGWKNGAVGDLVKGIRGVTFSSEDILSSDEPSAVVILRSNNIKDSRINFEEVYLLPSTNVSEHQIAQPGDVAVCMSNGSRRLVGKAARLTEAELKRRVSVGAFCALFRPTTDADINFVPYLFDTESYRRELDITLAGSAINNLKNSDIEGIKIPLPPLAEQRKIAEILRTWDEAIETAEAELKAKQERKRGLMIKCLGPAIEARGVNGWRTVRLGEICNPQQWTTIVQSQMTETGIPVYGANSYIGFFSEANHEDDVIAVSCRGSCGEVAFVSGPSYVTGNSMCLDDLSGDEADIYWLYQCLKLRGFRDIISGSAQPQIIRKDVIKVKISMPSLTEQKKAAEILRSADQDIETINNRIEALRTQKRGLMQKLLTGEVRVAA